MNLKLEDLKEGDVVIVDSNFGSGPLVTGIVINVEADIKNGRPGIDYKNERGSESWAYLSQVVQKVSPLKFVSKIEPSMG